MPKHVIGIDIGSHHVKVVIAERPENPRDVPRIVGTGYAESRGVKEGYIVSIAEASRSIGAAVAQAAKAARIKVKRAYLAAGGVGLGEAFARGEVVVERGDSEVSSRDMPRALRAAEATLPPHVLANRRILHTIPLRYYVDGQRVLGKSPIGMKGARLAVDVLFITCLERHIADFIEAVEQAGVEVEDVVAAPLAASFTALTKSQKRVGSVLVNIGSETMSAIVFEDTMPISVRIFATGSNDITNDLALALRISPEEAEQYKAGAVLGAQHSRKKVDDTIGKRAADMFKQLEAQLKKIEKSELLPGGVVLTGGGAMLVTMQDAARAVLRLPARLATYGEGPAAKIQLQDTSWAVAYGLTLWGFTQGDGFEGAEHGFFDFLSGLWRWFRKFLP